MECRKWLQLISSNPSGIQFTIMSFNLLAQTLIQTDLFTHCDSQMLRWKHRKKRVLNEIKLADPDIILAQEVDSYKEHYETIFDQLGYNSIYDCGRGKKHGCCIAFKKHKFELLNRELVYFDESEISPATNKTNNILQLAKIKSIEHDMGLILTNNHLYWHPLYDYERTRQFLIVIEATKTFSQGCDYPIINGGDFNTTPNSLGYLAITHQINVQNEKKFFDEINADIETRKIKLDEKISLTQEALKSLESTDEKKIKECEKEIEDLISCKQFLFNSDLLPIEKIVEMIQSNPPSQSAYANYTKLDPSYLEPTYGFEPKFTNVTPWFKGTLDFLFYRNTSHYQLEVDSLFSLSPIESLGDGLPNMEFGSDHLSLIARFNFKKELPN